MAVRGHADGSESACPLRVISCGSGHICSSSMSPPTISTWTRWRRSSTRSSSARVGSSSSATTRISSRPSARSSGWSSRAGCDADGNACKCSPRRPPPLGRAGVGVKPTAGCRHLHACMRRADGRLPPFACMHAPSRRQAAAICTRPHTRAACMAHSRRIAHSRRVAHSPRARPALDGSRRRDRLADWFAHRR